MNPDSPSFDGLIVTVGKLVIVLLQILMALIALGVLAVIIAAIVRH